MTTMQLNTRRKPVTDLEIMGLGLWLIAKPIFVAIELQGRLIDWRNRHLYGGE